MIKFGKMSLKTIKINSRPFLNDFDEFPQEFSTKIDSTSIHVKMYEEYMKHVV